MTVFGDSEPEDAWDASDAVDAKIANLRARLALLQNDADAALPVGDRQRVRFHLVLEDLLALEALCTAIAALRAHLEALRTYIEDH